MDKYWRFFIIVAIMMIFLYSAFEFYVSLTGGNAKFNRSVESIENNLGKDVLDHIDSTKNFIYYNDLTQDDYLQF